VPTLYCISSARIDFLLKIAFLLALTPPSTNKPTPPRLTLSSHCKGACKFLNLAIPSYRPLYNRLHRLWINCSHRPSCLVLRSYILTFALWLQTSRPRTPADLANETAPPPPKQTSQKHQISQNGIAHSFTVPLRASSAQLFLLHSCEARAQCPRAVSRGLRAAAQSWEHQNADRET
jgi:hypothetical protein